jgi:adenylate cyclase
MNTTWKARIFQVAAIFALTLLCLTARVSNNDLIGTVRGAGFDTLQRLWPRSADQPQPVRVVDIDEKSLKALGQWPWSRIKVAKLVDQLHSMGAAAVAFDIVFPEPDRLSPKRMLNDENLKEQFSATQPLPDTTNWPDSDAVFAASLANRPTVMAFATSSSEVITGRVPQKTGFAQTGAPAINAPPRLGIITSSLPELEAAAAGSGGINIDLAGEQGVARQIPFLWTDGERFIPSLSVEALRVAQGLDTLLINAAPDTENAIESLRIGELEIPLSERGQFFVYYRHNSPDMYVSAVDVLDPKQRERIQPLLEGHIVFIGTSAVGLLDVRATALGETVPGVSIHAQATEQILAGQFLTRPEWAVGLEYIAVILFGLGIAIIGAVYRPWVTFLAATTGLVAILFATVQAFRGAGILLDATFPIIALTLTFLASVAYRLAVTDKDGRNMRRMFGHYVAPAVLAEIEKNPQALKLGGEVRDVTVMFVDIANFTPLSEKLSPEELVQTVNGLWDACSAPILAEQGTIDKFIGDAVMAFWNAPIAVVDHQARAARAALGIRAGVAAYNAKPEIGQLLVSRNIPPIAVRVGIASGPACVGNMGAQNRFDYSVLGDTVNIAARTEATGKRVRHDILVAGQLHPATTKLAFLPAGHSPMKGKTDVEPIHALMGDEAFAGDASFVTLLKEHSFIVETLAKQPKPRALQTLRQVLDELALHHPLCANYLKTMADRPADFLTATKP